MGERLATSLAPAVEFSELEAARARLWAALGVRVSATRKRRKPAIAQDAVRRFELAVRDDQAMTATLVHCTQLADALERAGVHVPADASWGTLLHLVSKAKVRTATDG